MANPITRTRFGFMALLWGFTASLALSVSFECFSAVKTATVTATCRSLYEAPITWSAAGVGTITAYFTTFDAKSTYPLNQPVGEFVYFSGELRPRLGQAGVYEGDYLNYNSTLGVFAYGFGITQAPTTDSDGNGISDIFQFDKAGTVNQTGSIQSDFPSVIKYLTQGTLSKSANSSQIISIIKVTAPDGNVQTLTGSLYLSILSGTITYERGSLNQLNLNVAGKVLGSSEVTSLTGSTTFSVSNPNQIQLPQFSLINSTGQATRVEPTTLTRAGNKYFGLIKVGDGNLTTSWQDFVEWNVEFVGSNDSNGNGIPDLTDNVGTAPQITSHPISQAVKLGGTVTLTVEATAAPAPTYQWQFQGVNIPGAVSASLSVGNFQEANVGSYRAIVSNALGFSFSNPTILTVQLPIIQRPNLSIAFGPRGSIRISWPAPSDGFVLEATSINPPQI